MQVHTLSYDQGARVLLQQGNLTTCKWTNLKWLTATDKKILDIWNAAKNQDSSSPEYSLAKRQIQEVSRRHSDGFLGWLTRFYHRFLNLFGAGIKPQEEETLRNEISEGSGVSAPNPDIRPSPIPPLTPPSDTKPFITSPTSPTTISTLFSALKKAHWNFTQQMAEEQDIRKFLGQLLQSFEGQATAYFIRRDPNSSGYNIGFNTKNLGGFQKSIKSKLIDVDNFFDFRELTQSGVITTLWFSASQTRNRSRG